MKTFTLSISQDIKRALNLALPIVALESTVITHGLPYPQNISLAHDMEKTIREEGATPATIAVLQGKVHIGLNEADLNDLVNDPHARKISQRDFSIASIKAENGGTTVAGTMFAAQKAGIKVLATGGIGGVHRESNFDVSSDLQSLARIPMIVVCSGAKAILNLPATIEYLETMSVPVVGYQTNNFPAFYSRGSGLDVNINLGSPDDIVKFAEIHWGTGLQSAILVTNPVPEEEAISKKEIDAFIDQASKEAMLTGIRGQNVTPFLLQRINELSAGRSLQANLSLLLNNAKLGAQIAKVISSKQRQKNI